MRHRTLFALTARGLIALACALVAASARVTPAFAASTSVIIPASALVPSRATVLRDSLDAAALRALVESGKHPGMRFGHLDDVAQDMKQLYAASEWRPLWLMTSDKGMVASQNATELISAIVRARLRGLEPDHYEAGVLPAFVIALGTPEARAAFDVAFTASALRLLRSLHDGRITPSNAHASLRIPRPAYDPKPALLAIADSGNIEARLDAAEPPFLHYQRLKASLARYRALATDSALLSLPKLRPGSAINPGEAYAGMPALRRLLTALGDLPQPGYAPNKNPDLLLGDVLEGLRQFQRRVGLEVDGNLGAQTMARLTRPFDDRVQVIELSLERWRWLPHVFNAPPIIVNLPAFRLYAFSSSSDDERDLLMMDVAIGGSFDKKTPIFSDTLTSIVFAPYWDVPGSIAVKEILPKATDDASYLAKNEYEIVQGDPDASPVLPVSGKALSAVAKGTARIRQMPGKLNALGHVKFLFPNAFNIYFHDTPSKSAFTRARRDVSHGCIRLSDPSALAQFLLKDQPEWTTERIGAAEKEEKPERVKVKLPRPVFILYVTAMATQAGETQFYPDIYNLDHDLAEKIAKGYPYAH